MISERSRDIEKVMAAKKLRFTITEIKYILKCIKVILNCKNILQFSFFHE